jgi:hypothetical protein
MASTLLDRTWRNVSYTQLGATAIATLGLSLYLLNRRPKIASPKVESQSVCLPNPREHLGESKIFVHPLCADGSLITTWEGFDTLDDFIR